MFSLISSLLIWINCCSDDICRTNKASPMEYPLLTMNLINSRSLNGEFLTIAGIGRDAFWNFLLVLAFQWLGFQSFSFLTRVTKLVFGFPSFACCFEENYVWMICWKCFDFMIGVSKVYFWIKRFIFFFSFAYLSCLSVWSTICSFIYLSSGSWFQLMLRFQIICLWYPRCW